MLLFGTFYTVLAQVGCTDPLATNYDPSATINDGSCTYQNTTLSPVFSQNLSPVLNETSGLIYWNNRLWTHNDNSDINLYNFHPDSVNIIDSIELTGSSNRDQEEITQDSNYIYLGDFGNNANGNRTDLRILRIDKSDLLQNLITIDTIFFSYSDQINFTATGSNNTDFDCESFIVSSDSIFLFTKQWVSQKTAKYSLPKTPGVYVAQFSGLLNVQGLVTAATYLEDKRLLLMSGYSTTVQPFIYLLYDFNGTDFFGANKRKINLNLGFHQIEGICSEDGSTYYLTNERLSYSFITVEPKLHKIDLNAYLENYLNPPVLAVDFHAIPTCRFYPNPATEIVYFGTEIGDVSEIMLTNLSIGQSDVFKVTNKQSFNLSFLAKGVYQACILDEHRTILCADKIIKK
jgi:hypothetical protein